MQPLFYSAMATDQCYVQWNLYNPDTNGTEESVHISEVSLFRGLNCMQGLFSGKEKVSSLEKCPHFSSEGRKCDNPGKPAYGVTRRVRSNSS